MKKSNKRIIFSIAGIVLLIIGMSLSLYNTHIGFFLKMNIRIKERISVAEFFRIMNTPISVTEHGERIVKGKFRWYIAIPSIIAFLGFLIKFFTYDENKAPKTNNVNKPVSRIQHNWYYPIVNHVLLLIFTLGIWLLIWIYRTTDRLNCIKSEQPRNPATTLLLCMFVPFYYIYWTYKTAQRIDILAEEKGVQSGIGTQCLILAIFIGIIPPIIMQDKINAIVSSPQGSAMQNNAAPVNETPAPVSSAASGSSADELKKFKELLDMGAISQEEYDAKKKELLEL